MVKRYYIQDYPENFRGNTETRTIASENENKSQKTCAVVRAGGFLQVVNLNRVRK